VSIGVMVGVVAGVVAVSAAVHVAVCILRRPSGQRSESSYSVHRGDRAGSDLPLGSISDLDTIPDTLAGQSEYAASWAVQARMDLFDASD
jgi:hypothetical protein